MAALPAVTPIMRNNWRRLSEEEPGSFSIVTPPE